MILEKHLYLKENGCFSDTLIGADLDILKSIYERTLNLEFTNSCHTGYLSGYSNNLSFNELVEIKNKTLKQNKEETNVMQYWYFNPSIVFTEDEKAFISFICRKIVTDLYPDEVSNLYSNPLHTSLTMFDKGCFIINHADGGSGMNLCNILFYVNNSYKEGYGGELVVNDSIVINPEFGRYAVIDFYYSNPTHRVNEILDDTFQRKAFITSLPIIQTDK